MRRRKLLQRSLRAAAILAVAPSSGLSLMSELATPDEIRAYRDASRKLSALAKLQPGEYSDRG